MRRIESDVARDNCLRFVFNNRVFSFDLAVDATFEDIGRVLEKLAQRYHGHPIAIDVTLDWRGRRGRAEITTGGPLVALDLRESMA